LWVRFRKTEMIGMTGNGLLLGGRTFAWSEISGMQIGAEDNLELIRDAEVFASIDPQYVGNYESLVQTLVRKVRLDPELLDDVPTVTSNTLGIIAPRRIDFDGDGIRLHSIATGPLLIPIEDIASVGIAVDRERHLHTRVKVRGGADIDFEAGNGDPFELFETARRAYPDLVS
jgi:hypothetical protein